ncbi:MAG: TonB-dependent receptor [Brumimicrobium sp.]|nr:TonB-dependent receptor [Brumimicrobium sp.]
MIKYIILLVYLISTLTLFGQQPQGNKSTLKGIIQDSKSKEPIFGAKVYFPDIKKGATSDFQGQYFLENLPKVKLLVKVTATGYKDFSQIIDLTEITEFDIELTEAVVEKELDEVVVTGVSKSTARKKMPLPISTLSAKTLKQITASSIIEALTVIPGVSTISSGPGIAKPVIRGLGYNRVVVINNGIRQEGQQWGDEHGVEIDEFTVDHVEVLKGPASLIYGSDALAGVINFLPAPSPADGQIRGGVIFNYQTNNDLLAGSVNISGNQKGFIWDLRYSQKAAHDYKNKYDGYVFNSRFQENNILATIGLNKSWGFSHITFNRYEFTPGIIEGERDSIGQFIKQINNQGNGEESAIEKKDFLSYKSYVPFQRIFHYKVVSQNLFMLGEGRLKAIIGWQQNQRKEFESILDEDKYGLFLSMHTFHYDFRYTLPDIKHWDISFGMNGMYQSSLNKGEEFLIPDYNLFDWGVFAITSKSWEKLSFSAGIRYDLRTQHGKELWLDSLKSPTIHPTADDFKQFTSFQQLYQSISGSIGLTYQITSNLYTKINLAKGFRAPNIAELSANGVHEGTSNYIIGNLALKPENSWQADYAFGWNTEHVNGEITLFYNYIQDYIYYHQLLNKWGGDSLTEGYKTYQYTSADAHLWGGEISIDLHPHPIHWLHFENTFSYVQARQINSLKYIPFIPAHKWGSELRADIKKIGKWGENLYLSFGISHYFKQDEILTAYNTETKTPSYTLLHAGVGIDIVHHSKTLFSIRINVENITNTAYQNHLSRLKYLMINPANGRQGIYDMGRNFSFKVIIPIPIKS